MTLQKCKKCLPTDNDSRVFICIEYRVEFENGKLFKVCSANNIYIGCRHRYLKELDDLSLVKEKLIVL